MGGNVASTYGPGVASPPAQTLWTVSPEAAGAGGEVMSGAPLCAETGGCALAVEDGFANVATVPTVVQLSAVPGFLLGQQYVLVEDGTSGTMEVRCRVRFTPREGGCSCLAHRSFSRSPCPPIFYNAW